MTDKKNFFVHAAGICESEKIGKGTRIWAFTHILPGAQIGEDCNVCDHVFVENDVIIGNRVTLKCGVQIWDGIRLEDDVFVGPNVTFTNDAFPRSKQYPQRFPLTRVEKGASIGANATLLPGITIGQNVMIGAGAVVTKNVPPNAIVIGNPGRIVGYVTSGKEKTAAVSIPEASAETWPKDLNLSGSKLYRFPLHSDLRGALSVGEFGKDLPFQPKRYFLVFDVPTTEVRGEHAHHKCEQFLICVKGQCSVLIDDGSDRQEIRLDSPDKGLYLPAMTWGTQYKYTSDAVLLVFASEHYNASDYIRNYDEFVRLKCKASAPQP